MLPEGAHVKAAFLTSGTGALATSSKSKKLFLDCSTIDAASSLEVGKAVEKSGIGEFSDTPVSVLRQKNLS
jgi:3-hydroxyisobutyrate/3-hydroxypropionate dehydrogenase